MKRNKPITTLMHKHEKQTIKVKHKSKGREMQPQDNRDYFDIILKLITKMTHLIY